MRLMTISSSTGITLSLANRGPGANKLVLVGCLDIERRVDEAKRYMLTYGCGLSLCPLAENSGCTSDHRPGGLNIHMVSTCVWYVPGRRVGRRLRQTLNPGKYRLLLERQQ
jgi:hypothetical protein